MDWLSLVLAALITVTLLLIGSLLAYRELYVSGSAAKLSTLKRVRHDNYKYTVGDMFLRNYCGIGHICILLSKDLESWSTVPVWRSTMCPIFTDGSLGGGADTYYYDEDLNNLKYIGRLSYSKDTGRLKIK